VAHINTEQVFYEKEEKEVSNPAVTGVVIHPDAMLPSILKLIFLTPL
jgi:hypothetical protein